MLNIRQVVDPHRTAGHELPFTAYMFSRYEFWRDRKMTELYSQQLQTLNELLNQLWHINELSSWNKIRITADSILSFAQNLNYNFLHDSILDDYLRAAKKFPAENIPDDILKGIEKRIRIIVENKIENVIALMQDYRGCPDCC
jgi:hypothetical protein